MGIQSFPLTWIPSYGIDFTTYIDGLSLMFGLIIVGIGTLVVFYSIYYMSKYREALHNFYIYSSPLLGGRCPEDGGGLLFNKRDFLALESALTFLHTKYNPKQNSNTAEDTWIKEV